LRSPIAPQPFLELLVVVYGFLISKIQRRQRIITNDLRVLDLASVAGDPSLSVREVQLAEYASLALKEDDVYRRGTVPGFCWEMGLAYGATFRSPLSMSDSAMDFVLARACQRNGHLTVGRRLAARAIQRKLNLKAGSERLRDQLCVELCILFTDRAKALMSNPATSRREVLAQVEWVVESFPDGEERKEAEHLSRVLHGMVVEDEVRLRTESPRQDEPITPADLVYYLASSTEFVGGFRFGEIAKSVI